MTQISLDAAVPVSPAAVPVSPAAAPAEVAAVPPAPCVSCGAPRTGEYCGGCGQKVQRERFTLPAVLRHLVADALDLDRGILFTAWSLLRRPGPTIRAYLGGQTVRYTNPVKYLLIAVAAVVLVYVQMGVLTKVAASTPQGAAELNNPVNAWMVRHMNLVMLVNLPFISTASWLMFRRARLHYAEHLVFNVYVFAQQSLLGLALAAPLFASGQLMVGLTVQSLASYVYFVWAATGFFGERPLSALLRSLGTLLLGSLMAGVVVMCIVAAFALAEKLL